MILVVHNFLYIGVSIHSHGVGSTQIKYSSTGHTPCECETIKNYVHQANPNLKLSQGKILLCKNVQLNEKQKLKAKFILKRQANKVLGNHCPPNISRKLY